MKDYVGAIDQGTTSTRFMVFDKSARIVAVAQKEHEQIFPRPGWVEHDALEILRRTEEVITEALAQRGLRAARFPTPTPNAESWPVAKVPAST